jgi:hypothetical protein
MPGGVTFPAKWRTFFPANWRIGVGAMRSRRAMRLRIRAALLRLAQENEHPGGIRASGPVWGRPDQAGSQGSL